MADRKFGKVTMSTQEYRELTDEIYKAQTERDEAKRGQYEYFKRADSAETMVKHLSAFIQSDEDVLKKFNEYEAKHTGAKN